MPNNHKFVIEGGGKLEGEITVNGSKNAAGAILAATLLTEEKCVIDNVPKVTDILNLVEILEEMGAKVEWLSEHKLAIEAGNGVSPEKIDFDKFSKSRVSVLLIGALLARFKEFKISRPGGDRIGLRPITTHLQALEELGGDVKEEGDFYYFKTHVLEGKEIILSEFSVTATETV
ncbi:MAG: UDP-N-acetylglucosamine 1-carboxyvinyltransferase, partial [Candidatus Pacebacteria bacterium]|nr:UDP-N-acetylglucosamine 1-carboxyvinyltransferase [Candidatus Paceibacterota bacterium]